MFKINLFCCCSQLNFERNGSCWKLPCLHFRIQIGSLIYEPTLWLKAALGREKKKQKKKTSKQIKKVFHVIVGTLSKTWPPRVKTQD